MRWYNIIMCPPYSSIFPMEIYTSESQDWVDLLGTVCIVLRTHTHWRSLPISQPPNALVEDQVSASGMINFPLAEYCFPLVETQISASGMVLSASGQLAIRQRRGRNCVWTVLKKNVHISASTRNCVWTALKNVHFSVST